MYLHDMDGSVKRKAQLVVEGDAETSPLPWGRDGEWLTDTTCNRGYAGSIPVPASNVMRSLIETSYTPSKPVGRGFRNVSVRSIEFHRDTLR